MLPRNQNTLPTELENVLVTGGTFSQIQGDYHYHQYNTVQQETGLQTLSQEISHTAMHDSSARDPPPRCHPDTRKSIIEDLMRWIQDPNPDADAFWLHGTAGVGKSALLQTIADLLREMGQHFAGSFFFGRDKPGRDKSHYLIPTISYQLALLIPDLRGPIDQAMRFDPTIVKKTLDVQLQSLIIIPCQQSTSGILASHTPTVVIDGLDECSDHEQQLAILSVIAKAITVSHFPLRFLIASRPEAHISQFFKEASFKYASLWVPIDSEEVRDDIRKVFVDGFENIRRRQAFSPSSLRESWPGDDVMSLLVSRASGQFVYVDTVLRFVGAEHHKPSKQLDIILNMPRPSSSTALAAVDELYMQILHSCPYPEILSHILGFMDNPLGMFTPAKAGVIEDLFGLEDGDVSTVLQPLHSVIQCSATRVITSTVPEENEVLSSYYPPDIELSFYHASFSDFLQDRRRSGIFHVDREAVLDQMGARAANLIISSLQINMKQRRVRSVRNSTWCLVSSLYLLTEVPPIISLRKISYLANLDKAMQTLLKHCDIFPWSPTHYCALQFVYLELRIQYPPTEITKEESQMSFSILANCQKCLDRWFIHCFSTSRLVQDSPMALVLFCSSGVQLHGMAKEVAFGVVLEFLTRYPYFFNIEDCTFRFVITVVDFLLDETRSHVLHSVLRNQWLEALEPLFSVCHRGHGLLSIQDMDDPLVRLHLDFAYYFFRTSRISDIRCCDILEPEEVSPLRRLIHHLLQMDFIFLDCHRFGPYAIHPRIASLVKSVLMWAHRQTENKKCTEDAKNLFRPVMDKIFNGNFLLVALWTNYFPEDQQTGAQALDHTGSDSIPHVGMDDYDDIIFDSLEWFMAVYASICEYIMVESRHTKRMAALPTYHTRITEFLLHAVVSILRGPLRVKIIGGYRGPHDDHRPEDAETVWKEFTELVVKWSWHLGFSEKSEKITIALATIYHQCTVAQRKAKKPPYDLTMGAVKYLQKVSEPQYDYLKSWYKELESCRPG